MSDGEGHPARGDVRAKGNSHGLKCMSACPTLAGPHMIGAGYAMPLIEDNPLLTGQSYRPLNA